MGASAAALGPDFGRRGYYGHIRLAEHLRTAIHTTLRRFGVDINRLPPDRWLRRMPIRTVLDVGANTGRFAHRARRLFPTSQIYCFEPPNTTREDNLDDQHAWHSVGASDKADSIEILCKGLDVRSLLEIGSGTGAILQELDRRGFAVDYYCVEPSAAEHAYMTQHATFWNIW